MQEEEESFHNRSSVKF